VIIRVVITTIMSLLSLGLRPLGTAHDRSEIRSIKVEFYILSAENMLANTWKRSLRGYHKVDEIMNLLASLEIAEKYIKALIKMDLSEGLSDSVMDRVEDLRLRVAARKDMVFARMEELVMRSEVRRFA